MSRRYEKDRAHQQLPGPNNDKPNEIDEAFRQFEGLDLAYVRNAL